MNGLLIKLFIFLVCRQRSSKTDVKRQHKCHNPICFLLVWIKASSILLNIKGCPENIIPIFQPTYSPYLAAIERLWEHLKAQLRWENCQSLKQLRLKLSDLQLAVDTRVDCFTYSLRVHYCCCTAACLHNKLV